MKRFLEFLAKYNGKFFYNPQYECYILMGTDPKGGNPPYVAVK